MDLPLYCVVGVKPVKIFETEDGGMTCHVFNPETDQFERNMDYFTRCFMGQDPEVDVVTEEEFEQAIVKLRTSHAAKQ